MKRSVAAAGIFSVILGATALAGDQMAFDGMGAMMLEHEAGEQFDEVADQHVASSGCSSQNQMLKARMRELQETYSRTFAEMSSRLGKMDIQAIREHAAFSAKQMESLKVQRTAALKGVQHSLVKHRQALVKHRQALEKYRFAFSDKELLAQVEDALTSAERALLAE